MRPIQLVAILTCVTLVHSLRKVTRGYKSDLAPKGKYPYVVSLVYVIKNNLYRRCTGSAISPRWVLTVASCLRSDLNFVQYGDMSVPPELTHLKSRVLGITRLPKAPKENEHLRNKTEQAHGNKNIDEIAMLRIESTNLPSYGKISTVLQSEIMRQILNFVGFIRNRPQEGKRNKVLNYNQPLLIGEGVVCRCPADSPYNRKDFPLICLEPRSNYFQHPLASESGGPLFHKDKIVGMLSKDRNAKTMAFIAIHKHLHWIDNVVSASHVPEEQPVPSLI